MQTPDDLTQVLRVIRSTVSLEASGVSRARIATRVSSGELVRVGRGWFVPYEHWRTWYPNRRHLAAVIAAHRNGADPPLFSHVSAAALLGLPLWNLRESRVHVASARSGSRNPSVVRHRVHVDPADCLEVAGMRCTSPERTLADLAATVSDEILIGCGDALLRQQSRLGRSIDADACDAWRASVLERADRARGARGVRRLRWSAGFADARADSPLESVSRLRFARLGILVEIQVPIAVPGEVTRFVDFELIGRGILGECDGAVKYTDPVLLGGQSPGEAVLREKRRDDGIVGRTGSRIIHWGAREAASTERFAGMLRGFRVPM